MVEYKIDTFRNTAKGVKQTFVRKSRIETRTCLSVLYAKTSSVNHVFFRLRHLVALCLRESHCKHCIIKQFTADDVVQFLTLKFEN